MTHRAFQQAHNIPTFLALFDQAEYRIQCFKKTSDNLSAMFNTDIDTVACKISFGKHLLSNKSLVSQSIRALESEPC